MTEDKELTDQLEEATGLAYGTGTDADVIAEELEKQRRRWETVAESEGES